MVGAKNMLSALPRSVIAGQSWTYGVVSVTFPNLASIRVSRRLLEVPEIRQGDHDHAKYNTVDDEHPQTVGLQVANEPGDGSVTNNRGNDNAHQERRMHPGRQTFLAKFVGLQQRCASDQRSGEQKTKAHRSLPGHVAEQTRGNG